VISTSGDSHAVNRATTGATSAPTIVGHAPHTVIAAISERSTPRWSE